VLACALLAVAAPRADAQPCTTGFLPGLRTPTIASSNAAPLRVLVPFAGEQGESQLLAAGQFTNIEGSPASSIAIFDGTRWTNALPLPGRLLNATIEAATQFGGAWHAGGTLTSETGALDVLRWVGDGWSGIGAELSGGIVRALAVNDGQLFIGGDFASSQQRDDTRGLVRFDGTSVLPAGFGLAAGGVRAMLVHDGQLHVAGSMPGAVLRWDSASQSLIASPGLGATDIVRGLAVLDGQLHAAGSFASPAGPQGLARWDGATWSVVDAAPSIGPTQAIVAHAGELVLATTTPAPALPNATLLYAWNGTHFRALTDTLDPLGVIVQDGGWLALASHEGRLLAAGFAGYSAPGLPNGRTTLFRIDTAPSNAPPGATRFGVFANGVDGTIADIALFEDRVVLAGSFRVAGGRRVNGVAAWDGAMLVPLGAGPLQALGISTAEAVLDLHVHNNVLHASGQMNASTPTGQLGGIARWTGTSWVRTVPGATGNPTPQILQLHSHEGQLFAATNGNVSTASGTFAGVIRLGATGWLGTGIATPSAQHTELESLAGSLIAAGELQGLRRWNGTTAWTPIASTSGIGGRIVDLLNDGSSLLLLADTPFTPGGAAASSVLRMQSDAASTIVPIGRLSVSLSGSSAGQLALHQGDIIAGKQFRVGDSSTPNARLARWNGIAWQPMPSDVLGAPPNGDSALTRVNTMLVQPLPDGSNVLWVGGFFGFAGSTSNPSPFLARYVAGAAPQISQQPESTSVCPGTTATFLGATQTTEGTTYRWLRGGTLLLDGPLAGVGTIAGSTTPTLRIESVQANAAGSYSLLATTNCGTTLSSVATLDVKPPAPTFGTQPAPQTLYCPRDAVELRAVTTPAGAQFEWRFEGAALFNGPQPSGATISGADTPVLRIENAQASDAGSYKCYVFNDCGFALSTPAMLTLRSACCDSIDFNNDALFPSDDDLLAFLDVLAGSACDACNDIDFNNDALFPTDDDLVAFLRVLAGGSCDA
jgi:hypothetical protein